MSDGGANDSVGWNEEAVVVVQSHVIKKGFDDFETVFSSSALFSEEDVDQVSAALSNGLGVDEIIASMFGGLQGRRVDGRVGSMSQIKGHDECIPRIFGYRSWREHGGASVSCGLGTGMPYRHAPVSTVSILHLDPTSTWRATSSVRPTLDLRHATDFTIKVSRLLITRPGYAWLLLSYCSFLCDILYMSQLQNTQSQVRHLNCAHFFRT